MKTSPELPSSEPPSARPHWHRTTYLWRRSRAALPVNSDIEVARTVAGISVMVRIRPSYLGLAALGGAVGTSARFALTAVAPSWHTLSAGTVVVNLLGPYLLGVMLQWLAVGAETRGRRGLRLLVGVGFLGALTSYAQLANDTVVVAMHGHVLFAVIYAVATVSAGAAAVWLGIVTSLRWQQTHPPRAGSGL